MMLTQKETEGFNTQEKNIKNTQLVERRSDTSEVMGS